MNQPTRRTALRAAGLTLCSAFFGGIAGQALGKEIAGPPLDSDIEPPPIAPGESRVSRYYWYKNRRATGSQALIATYGDMYGITREQAMRMACGFSGGIGLTGEVCGLVNASIILIGLKYGPSKVGRDETYNNMVELAKQFSLDFRDKHKTVLCRELIQFDISTPEQYAKAKETEGIWNPCIEATKTVLDLLENKYDILNPKTPLPS